ncbi:MAG TPA: autotransporter-associated beta strand repeat-containing protein, partial [Verrucomicrobiae bacterium]|nr:autotransporter-associated beta strand repeat-containing protein [Verrucomicrobiae bacterium]
ALIVNQSISEQVTNPIPGVGSLTKLGNGTLTLTGTNGYTGNTFVFGGTLALSGAGTISNSASVVISNATLDVTGVTGKTLLNSLSTSNSTLNLALSANLAIPVNVVNGNWTMGGSTNNVNISALPPIASYPTTLTIAQCPGGVFGFNLGLGSLPAGSPSFAGNLTLSSDNTTVFLTLTNGPISVRASVLWVGTNNTTVTTNWSDSSNWQLPGVPTPADNVVFAQNGSVSGTPFNSVGDGHDGIVNSGNLNNIVNSTLSVGTLLYTNIGGGSFSQNALIANGATLNILSNGSLTVGNGTLDFGPGATEFVTIAGTNGTLNINNTNGTTYVGLGNSTNGTELATLDLSGLGNLNASVGRFLVGVGSGAEGISISRTAGIVYLAQTNIITAYTTSGSSETSDTANNTMTFNVGEDDGNAGLPSALYLGQTNAIMADAVGTGREKSGAAMAFNPNLITANTQPTAYFRGANSPAVTTWSIGDQVANSGSGENANGTNDFTGGRVDALVNTLFVGRASSSATSSGTSSGTLTFDNGIFNVTTAFIGLQPTNSVKVTTGTINVKTNSALGTFATLLVSGNLNLGVTTTGGTAATGNLNIDGGTVQAGTILCGGSNSITLGASGIGGTLAVNNTLGAPGASLNALNLDGNTVLSLPASNTAPAVVNTLTIDGQAATTNIVNISSLLGTITPPMELPVIQYTTLNNTGGTFNMGLGTLPAGYSGFFTNDTTHSTIGVVITSVPVSGPSTNANITHISVSGTNLLVLGTNNNVPNTNFHYVVLLSTNVATPLSNWTAVATNAFNPDGTFDYTNPIVPGTSRQFIDVKVVP